MTKIYFFIDEIILKLGWQDSNLRMAESKSTALPLGDTPKRIIQLNNYCIVLGKKGFEPLTPWFVATCSSPLSYKPSYMSISKDIMF